MVGRAQVNRMKIGPAKITELSREKRRNSYQDATNHNVKVGNLNHRPVLGL